MKIISKIFSTLRKKIFFKLIFYLFFLFLPGLTFGGLEDAILNALLFLPFVLAAIGILLVILITLAIAYICGAILDLVISPSFFALSYTNPANNPIIAAGLAITQGFVNIIIVVSLIFSAIAVALRMGETKAKQTIVKLIMIALLVNFVPVFCGLVVDGANIIMNYFLENLKGGVSGVLTQVQPFVDRIIALIMLQKTSLHENLPLIMMGIIQILINIAIAVAFLFFAFVFLLRYLAIWTLVILAPIAFAGLAFPKISPREEWQFLEIFILPLKGLRDFWDTWLKQFVEWTIIGIPLAFFLYLALGSFSLMSVTFKQTPVAPPGGSTETYGFLGEVIPYLVVTIFLFLGFKLGLETGAMGARSALTYGTAFGLATAKFGGKKLRTAVSAALGPKFKQTLARQATAKLSTTFGTSRLGRTLSKIGWIGGFTPAIWAVRRGLGEFAMYLQDAEKRDIEKGSEKYKGKRAERKLIGIQDSLRLGDFKTAIGILKQAINEGQLSELKRLGLTEETIVRLGRSALKTHPTEGKDFAKIFPHLSESITRGFDRSILELADLIITEEDRRRGIQDLPTKIVSQMSPQDATKMDRDAFRRPVIMEALHRFATGNHIATLANELGRNFIEEFQRGIDERGLEWYEQNNSLLARYLTSSAASSLWRTRRSQTTSVRESNPSESSPSASPPSQPPPSPPTPPPSPRGRPGI